MTDRDELEYFIRKAKDRGDAIEVRYSPEGYIDAVAWGAASCWYAPISFAEKARPVFGRMPSRRGTVPRQ
jgi:hypothetical protein